MKGLIFNIGLPLICCVFVIVAGDSIKIPLKKVQIPTFQTSKISAYPGLKLDNGLEKVEDSEMFLNIFKPLELSTIGLNLSIVNNSAFVGDIYLGSNEQKARVIFDPSFGDLFVDSIDCTNCYGKSYNATDSATSSKQSSTTTSLTYNSNKEYGFIYSDTFCLYAGNTCTIQYKFLELTLQSGFDVNVNGVIGLMPGASSSSYSNLIDTFFFNGQITNKIFSFTRINNDEVNLEIGGYQQYNSSYGQLEFYYVIQDSKNWEIPLVDIFYKETSQLNDVWPKPLQTVIFNQQTQFMQVPSTVLTNIVANWVTSYKYIYYDQSTAVGQNVYFFYGRCSDRVNDFDKVGFTFMDGNSTYYVSPKDYLLDGYTLDERNICIFGFISSGSTTQFVINYMLLQNYQVVYDYDNKTIGLASTPFTSSAIFNSVSAVLLGFYLALN